MEINNKCMPWGRNNNPLLLKSDVGKVKPSAYDLPGQNFAYGKSSGKDGLGAQYLKSFKRSSQQDPPIKLVTNNWQQKKQQPVSQLQRNFIGLNKIQASAKIVTAKQATQFRKHHDSTKKQKQGHKTYKIVLPQQQFRYGIQNRPSTPIKLVVGNCYGLQAQSKQQQAYNSIIAHKGENKKLQSRMTRTQLLRDNRIGQKLNFINSEKQPTDYKLAKFVDKPKPKVNTNLKAFQKLQSD